MATIAMLTFSQVHGVVAQEQQVDGDDHGGHQ
jgi:hypothetical protein